MRQTKFVALNCSISRGGFSDERVFTLTDVKHEGISSRRYLWKADGTPVEDGEPPLGKKIQGFVAARVIDVSDDQVTATVSIPDGEVITVPVAKLVQRPNVGEHVPI